MMQTNPFDQFDDSHASPVITKPADPNKRALDDAELRGRLLNNQRTRQIIQEYDATHPATPQLDPALDRLTGDAYLRQLPPATAAQVQALSAGRLAFPSGAALRSPYWQQMLTHVAHYDPSFDSVQYGARYAAQKDFSSGNSSKNIKALNTAIGHVGQLASQIDATASHGGFPFATSVNQLENSFKRGAGDPGITNYAQTAAAVASELTSVFRGSVGAEADVKRFIEELDPNNSAAQKRGAIRNIVGLLKSRLDAISGQYTKAMGPAAEPLQILSPHAQHVVDSVMPGFDEGGPSGGGTPPGSPPPVAGGGTKLDRNPERERVLDGLIRSGADIATINAKSKAMGGGDLDPGDVQRWQQFYRANPNYGGNSVDTSVAVPTTGWNRFAASPLGTGIYAAVDGGMGGTTDEIASMLGGGDLADLNARKQAAFAANPKSAFTGQALGTAASMFGLGRAAGATGIASAFRAPQLAGDIAFSTASGVGQSNDNRILGGAVGALGGIAGNAIGNGAAKVIGAAARTAPGLALVNKTRGIFGASLIPRADPLGSANNAILTAAERAGPDAVAGTLNDASALNVPMSLADTHPNFRELAGAAVRRSPEAAAVAESALIPRSRGQYDRFVSSVERDLGPTANIPQTSANLSAQARAAAAPLYDQAYSRPVTTTPELNAVLDTPFARQAVGRARTIAANERRAPEELGFALDNRGDAILNPQPNDAIARHLSARADLDQAQNAYRAARATPGGNVDSARNQMLAARERLRQAQIGLAAAPDPTVPANVPAFTTQTLDYVKRGMDDVLEQQRNPITGKLTLDEAGRAQNQVRGQLLSEVDRLNPDFAQARQAYAGPIASRDALARGGDAYRLHPDELSMQVGTQTPEHLGQMQLGYRGAMVDHAGRVRDNSNPWDATLGSPMSRDRLGAMYPDSPGVDRLLRARQMESDMQQTTNAILGNSRTARNLQADQAFADNPAIEGALHAGAAIATHGASLPGTAARLAGSGIRSRMALGLGRQAQERANEIIPKLTFTDPVGSLAIMNDLLAQQRDRVAFIAATQPKRLGMFGAALGGQAATMPLNQ